MGVTQIARDEDGHHFNVEKFSIYVDGSFAGQVPTWGFVVLAHSTSGRIYRIGHCGGYATCDANSPVYVGVQVPSSYTAELSGLTWALRWTAQKNIRAACDIYCDNLAEVKQVTGQWHAKAEPLAISVATAGIQLASLRKVVHIEYTKGHDGNPWNEYADRICAALPRGEVPSLILPFAAPSLPRSTPHRIEWTTSWVCGQLFSESYPPIVDGKFVVSLGDAARGCFNADLYPTAQPLAVRRKPKKIASVEVCWCLIQFNVLSLGNRLESDKDDIDDISLRTAHLDRVFHAHGAIAIGLQEARTRGPS